MAAIAVGFTICASAVGRAEHASSVDVEAALARVNAARAHPNVDPLILEEALGALGHASLEANQYSTAEAAYAEALQLAEQHGGGEGERTLSALLGLAIGAR